MPISQAQQEQILGVMNDPEKRNKLSSNQLVSTRKLLVEYQTDLVKRNDRLRAEGLDESQIARVNAAGAEVTPTEGQPDVSIGTLGSGESKLMSPRDNAAVVDGAKLSAVGVMDSAKDIEVGLRNTVGANAQATEINRNAWKESLTEWRTVQRIEQMGEFGQLAPEGWTTVGEVVPYIFAAPAAAQTYGRLFVKRVVQGGAFGMNQLQREDQGFKDRLFSTAVGGVIGAITTVPSMFAGVKKWMAQSFTRNFNNANAQQADRVQQNVRQMTGDESFQFSVGQATGGRKAVALETRAASEETKAAQNNNLNILSRFFFDKSRAMSDAGASPGQIAIRLRNTLENIHRTVSSNASNAWRKGHSALLEKFGDDIVIRGDDYLAKIDKLLLERNNVITNPGRKGLRGLTEYRNQIDKLVNPVQAQKNGEGLWQLYDRKADMWLPTKSPSRVEMERVAIQQNRDFGGLDTETTLDIMKGLNSLIGGKSTLSSKSTPGSNREIGRALLGNFTDSLKSTAQSPEAVAGINAMRTAYKEQMAYLQAVDDTIISRIFGGKKLPENPGKALDQVLKQEPADLAATAQLLERHNPMLLTELRSAHMGRIHGGALTGKNPIVDTEVNLDKFLTRLEGSMNGTGMAGAGLHSPAAQAEILTAAKALRTIKNRFFTGVAPDKGATIDDIAINAVSRSPEFMARLLTRVVTTGKSLESGMLDQSFREAMEVMAKAQLGSEPMKAAVYFLTGWANDARAHADWEAQKAENERRKEVAAAGFKGQLGD